jgi:hypothetical protein
MFAYGKAVYCRTTTNDKMWNEHRNVRTNHSRHGHRIEKKLPLFAVEVGQLCYPVTYHCAYLHIGYIALRIGPDRRKVPDLSIRAAKDCANFHLGGRRVKI